MMTNSLKFAGRLKALALLIACVLTFGFFTDDATAQEPPPFWYYLTPAFTDSQITYRVEFDSRVDWPVSELVVQVALPEGTRFLQASPAPGNTTDFDGQYVKFYIPVFANGLSGNSFTVARTDPSRTVYNTHTLIDWKGTYPGSVRIDAEPLDTTLQPLNWESPGLSRLQLGVKAVAGDNSVTYNIYPKAIERRYRMWDVRLSLLIPPGAAVADVQAPPAFSTSYDQRAVYFSALELERLIDFEPLIATFTLTGTASTGLNSQLWATWRNGLLDPLPRPGPVIIYPDTGVEEPRPPQEETVMVDVSINNRPQPGQQFAFDTIGDAAFPDYDLASITLSETESAVNFSFATVGQPTAASQPARYTIYLNVDCNSQTGSPGQSLGAEYRVDYATETGRAFLISWDDATQDWLWDVSRPVTAVAGKQNHPVTVSVPNFLFATTPRFCWVGASRTSSGIYFPEPPQDWLTNIEFHHVTQYTLANSIVPDPGIPPEQPLSTGKLAVPMNNGQGSYDVFIFTMADLEEVASIAAARQPQFRADGQALLINRQHALERSAAPTSSSGQMYTYVFKNIGLGDNIQEYNLADGSAIEISGHADDSHPFYGPDDRQRVYGNATEFKSGDGTPLARLVLTCAIDSPRAGSADCQPANRLLASSDQPQGVWGRYPLWTAGNTIIFQGCTVGQNSDTVCGLLAQDARSLVGSPALTAPLRLTTHAGDIPSDTKFNRVAFTSQRDGNWEAYLMKLDGSGLVNLSNSPLSNDGLPTISPDGSQVAFVSDRDGTWAIWLTSITGGPAKRLFGLYGATALGQGDDWLVERISWGR